MAKPILFLTSANIGQIENLYYLRDLGTVLNFADEKVKEEDVKNYGQKNFLVCNVKSDEEVAWLRFINLENVLRVAVLRRGESTREPWVEKLKPDHVIKNFDFVRQCRTPAEMQNYIRHLAMIKKPDGDAKFLLKKLWSFLAACLSKAD